MRSEHSGILLGAAIAFLGVVSCGNASSSSPPATEPRPATSAKPDAAQPLQVPWTEPLEPDSVGNLLSVSFLDDGEAAPAFCAARLARPKPLLEPCSDLASARELLADALDERTQSVLADETHRRSCDPDALSKSKVDKPRPPQQASVLDAKLASLEACIGFPPGFVRVLRAELALDCADVLAVDALKRAATGKNPPLGARFTHALYGAALAARLLRLPSEAPAFRDKTLELKQADRYIENTLGPWVVKRSTRLRELAAKVEFVPAQSQGGALARLAVSRTWQAFLGGTRSVSIPDDWKRNYEQRKAFYSSLDAFQKPFVEEAQKLLPATRFAFEVLGQVRAQEGLSRRQLTSETSRVARWSDVLLPNPDLPGPSSAIERLAIAVPAPLLTDVVPAPDLTRPGVLRGALFQGFSVPARVLLSSQTLEPPTAALVALGHLTVALSSRSPSRARHARELAAAIPNNEDAALIAAIAGTVASFPENPDAWGSNAFSIDLGPLANFSGSDAAEGLVSLDARLLHSIASMAPVSTPPKGWEELFAGNAAFGKIPAHAACFSLVRGADASFLGKRSCACPYVFTR